MRAFNRETFSYPKISTLQEMMFKVFDKKKKEEDGGDGGDREEERERKRIKFLMLLFATQV